MKQSLQEIWQELANEGYETDKGSIHAYIPVYEQILEPYRETAKNVIEIGIFHGNSLRMWERYFTNASVFGVDCSDQPINGMADLRPMIASGKHNIHILDGTSDEQIEKEFAGVKFDIVWDDGSHLLEHQLQTVKIFGKRLAPNGIIILEDIQDLDKDMWAFEALTSEYDVTVADLRSKKGRYDDCLIIIKNKQ